MKSFTMIAGGVAAGLLLSAGCASIGNPSGGPRDERPPRFVHANPAPGTVNFNGHRAVIEFDELINVTDAFSNVVISPPGGSVPRVSSQGRRAIVTFPDTLQPNTTYTIDFGSAIVDNNEGNALENFSYSFSTGETIDTLRIAGMALNSETLEPMQRKIVGVHSILADSALLKIPFTRIAKTDDRGRFSVEGLAPGRYRLFALDDVDNNYIFSSPEEEMAFSDVEIEPYVEMSETVDSIYNLKTEKLDTVLTRVRPVYLPNDVLLRTFNTDRKQQYVTAYSRKDSTVLNINFNTPHRIRPTYSIAGAPDMKDWYVEERSVGSDTVSLWLKKPSLIKADTLRLAVNFVTLDSVGNYVSKSDTLRFTTDRPKPSNIKHVKKKKVEENNDTIPKPTVHLRLDPVSGQEIDFNVPLIFDVETPLAEIYPEKFHLEEKKDTLWIPLRSEPPVLMDSINPRRYKIDFPSGYGKEIRLTIDTIAAVGLYGLHTGPQEKTFKVREADSYSSLTVLPDGIPSGIPAFVQLLKESGDPVRKESVEGGRAVFRHLLPGKYYMRMYLDFNGNGKYDTGDYYERRQPDQVFYYPKMLNIKRNWEKEESWNILAIPLDKQKPYQLLKNRPTLKKGEKAPEGGDDEEEE